MADPHFRAAQIHYGTGPDATPADVALTALQQAARDVSACLRADPFIRLTLPVPHGLWEPLLSMIEPALSETPAKEP